MSITLDDLQKQYPNSMTFKFGDHESLCKRLLDLIREGKKTATCGALRDFEAGGEVLPVVGRRDIALNWDGSPAIIVETVEVTTRRFCDVDEAFALEEGENDDLEGWRKDHQLYFERNGGFYDEMMLVCERFKLIVDLETSK